MNSFPVELFCDIGEWRHREVFSDSDGVWTALGANLNAYLADWPDWSIMTDLHPGVHLLGDHISIGAGCRIEPGVVIIGPAVIGEGVMIRTGAYVRENVILGRGSIVGAHSEVKGSILFPGAKAPHQNYVGDSILGREVNLGAGTICSNVKNVGSEVSFSAGEHLIKTGLRKFGAVLGDGCKTGCNTVLNPGVLMGKASVTYPNATMRSGFYPEGTLVKVRQEQHLVEMTRLRR